MHDSLNYRRALIPFGLLMLLAPIAIGQQPAASQPGPPIQLAPNQPIVPQQMPGQAPKEFQLNALEQTYLDQVLTAWEAASDKIDTFKCPFERWEYDPAFGPKGQEDKIPLNKNLGELSYQRPDKGSFEITEIRTFQTQAAPPGQPPPAQVQGNWVTQPNAIGEDWVCDGNAIYEYRTNQKQLVEHPIPPNLRGRAIADGPLPFLFGSDAKTLKAHYWIRVNQPSNPNPNEIWLIAKPKSAAQAADFSTVDVMLDRQRLLPMAMRVHMPNGALHVYIFNLKEASINNPLARVQAWFSRPRLPSGWSRIVEEIPAQQAAAQPAPPPR